MHGLIGERINHICDYFEKTVMHIHARQTILHQYLVNTKLQKIK